MNSSDCRQDGFRPTGVQLWLGRRNAEIIHVDDLSDLEYGLNCLCDCPACGSRFVARFPRRNPKRRRFYAHYRKNDCNLDKVHQTMLHQYAIQLLREENHLHIPEYVIDGREDQNEYEVNFFTEEKLLEPIRIHKDAIIPIDRVSVETRLEGVIPDILIESGSHQLIVEIAVTHFADDAKQKRIRELGISTLEIDLRAVSRHLEMSSKALREVVVDGTKNKVWKYHKSHEAAYNKLLERNAMIVEKYKEERKRLEKIDEQRRATQRMVDAQIETQRRDHREMGSPLNVNITMAHENQNLYRNKNKRIFNPDTDVYDFEFNGWYYDVSGNRLLGCTKCRKILKESEMSYYQNSQGICFKCIRLIPDS